MTSTHSAVPTTPPRSADPLLSELLDRELDWSPFARPPYISHFSMGLVAARRLGASDDELRAQFDAEANGGFNVARQRPECLAPDTARIAREGIAEEITGRLPALLISPDEQFFHAAIRLELAVDAGHAGQVANALRTWEDGIAVSAREGHAFRSLDGEPPVVDPHVELQEQSVRAGHAFMAAPNFSTLHLVTGTRALSTLVDYLDPADQELLSRGTRAAVTGRLSDLGLAGDHPFQPADVAAVDWERLGRSALDSGDTHTEKLVYACRLQEAATGDRVFAAVAASHLA